MKLSLSGTCSGFFFHFFLLPPFHTIMVKYLLHSHKLTFSVVWKHGGLKFSGSHHNSLTERRDLFLQLEFYSIIGKNSDLLRSVHGLTERMAVSPELPSWESLKVVARYKFYFFLISQSFVDGSSHVGIPSLRVSEFSTRLYAPVWQRKTERGVQFVFKYDYLFQLHFVITLMRYYRNLT